MDDIFSLDTEEITPSLSRSITSRTVPSPIQHAHTSSSIKRALLHDQQNYRVQSNSSNRATAQCWKLFGFPAKMKENSSNEFIVIPGFASCKTCFETYKYMDSSTGNMNSHQCSRSVSSDQQTLSTFVRSPHQNNGKILTRKKEEMKKLCVRWIASSMRPFQIVSDPGLKQIIQASINLGLYLEFSR
jgi:hypothetical protein